MSRFVFILLATVAVLVATTSAQQCGNNEEYVTCGTACEPSCAVPRVSACTYECTTGCQCISGYLRNSKRLCVHPSSC